MFCFLLLFPPSSVFMWPNSQIGTSFWNNCHMQHCSLSFESPFVNVWTMAVEEGGGGKTGRECERLRESGDTEREIEREREREREIERERLRDRQTDRQTEKEGRDWEGVWKTEGERGHWEREMRERERFREIDWERDWERERFREREVVY